MKPANGTPKIEDYYSLPKAIAGAMTPWRSYADFEDACQEGMIGLFKAFRHKDEMYTDASFKSYVRVKVRGAILDHFRKQDRVPRWEVKKEVTEEMKEKRYNFINPQSLDAHCEGNEEMFSVHEAVPDSRALMPDEGADRGYLYEQIDSLPEMQRKVLALYYFEGLKLREIGEAFGLTESRIGQIRGQGVLSLKRLFGEKVIQNKNGSPRKRQGLVKNVKLQS